MILKQRVVILAGTILISLAASADSSLNPNNPYLTRSGDCDGKRYAKDIAIQRSEKVIVDKKPRVEVWGREVHIGSDIIYTVQVGGSHATKKPFTLVDVRVDLEKCKLVSVHNNNELSTIIHNGTRSDKYQVQITKTGNTRGFVPESKQHTSRDKTH